jgi:16S rRNA (guanine527-N7)-methyltransferase
MREEEAYDFLEKNYNVSRETFSLLSEFHNLLLKWNKIVHLISTNESNNLWDRHIIDCVELTKIMRSDKNSIITDFGSGTGFPGIIIGLIMDFKELNLIESNQKKTIFLEEAARLSNKKIYIHNERIENIKRIPSDIITSRAFSDLKTTLDLAKLHCHSDTKLYNFKGRKLNIELEAAKKNWHFDFNKFPSNILNDSFIVEIINFSEKK